MSFLASIQSLSNNNYLKPLEITPERIGRSVEAPFATQNTETVKPGSFTNVIEKLVDDVSDKMNGADALQKNVLSGESDNLHQAMIAMQEAGVAFSLMVEVRNKLVESYQEIMRMQV